MSDPVTTLRALADACDRCDRIAHTERDDLEMLKEQRAALMRALPEVEGWPATADELRAMADEVEWLRVACPRELSAAEIGFITKLSDGNGGQWTISYTGGGVEPWSEELFSDICSYAGKRVGGVSDVG